MAGISKTNEGNNIDGPLANKIALVTGGGRGIGRAIAMKLAELGAGVASCGQDSDKLGATANALRGQTKRVVWQTADVRREDEGVKLFSATDTKISAGRLPV